MLKSSPRLLAGFIANLKNNVRSEDTIDQYTSTLRAAERFFISRFGISIFDKDQLHKLDIEHIEEWVTYIRESNVSLSSCCNYYYRMRSYLRWLKARKLVEESFISTIPSLNAAVAKQRVDDSMSDTSKVYSDADIINMLQIAQSNKRPLIGARNAALIAMLAGSGMRTVEVLSLTVADYLAAAETHILPNVKRKGNMHAQIPFAAFVAPYVDHYLSLRGDIKDTDPLFVSARGNKERSSLPLNRHDARASIAVIQKQAGVRTGLHNFRHTVVSRIVENNPTGVATAVAGHTNERTTTNNYIHIDSNARRAVVDSLSINQLLSKKT